MDDRKPGGMALLVFGAIGLAVLMIIMVLAVG